MSGHMLMPYIYTSERDFVTQAVGFDNEKGALTQEIGGEHAIWAARVPFLPALMSQDFVRMGRERIPLIMRRQFRFIYDLARAREHRATFELRYIATPNPVAGQPNLIDIVFLGKVFSSQRFKGQALAEHLWDKFVYNYPLEDPFNYPLEPVTDEAEFWRYYQPLDFDELPSENILEIRKYEDMPIDSTAPFGRVARIGDYIAHPFVPNVDFNPMGRFLVALASQPQRCYVGISLRPTRMFDQEIHNVSFAIGQFKRTAIEDDDVTEEYIRTRSKIGVYVYQQLMQEREQLVMVRVSLVGEYEAPRGLAEALGSEMMGNAQSGYPTQWVSAVPADASELESVRHNLRYLEHDFWGHTIAAPPMQRLRYLATAQEAYGAFRLPVPPESGYMPGVLVKDEPFVAPADELELRRQARANLDDPFERSAEREQEKKVVLAQVYHRGNPTAQDYTLNVRDLTRHALIAGSTGSGKSTTIKHLLSQLWRRHQIPFLVLYPVNKPDYRELFGFNGLREDLLIFTLGDESTAPFRFNPFEVPSGLLLKTHLSRLMRVFMAAFDLFDPLPMIYREALREVYRDKGWDTVLERGSSTKDYPIMSEFYMAIQKITESLNYGREVQDNVRQASVIRIGDLLENAGHVVNVPTSMSFDLILQHPTVMEVGRVGSTQDTALLMGFLLMRFAEEVERHPRPPDHPHITVIEEAHRLMADVLSGDSKHSTSRGAAGEDFSNILAEVRGYGEGIIIAEQIPTMLVKGAIGNTYVKLMHWLEDEPSFELFSNVMNLDERQREYARSLTPGFAIVRSPYGRPVHIKVPEFGDQDGFDKEASRSTSDKSVKSHMETLSARIDLKDVTIVKWEAGLQALETHSSASSTDLDPKERLDIIRHTASLIMRAPMQTCAYCDPLHSLNKCPYVQIVSAFIDRNNSEHTEYKEQILAALDINDKEERWHVFSTLGEEIGELLSPDSIVDDKKALIYCYLAHVSSDFIEKAIEKKEVKAAKNLRKQVRFMLYEFHSNYQGRT
jgi:energy-coupling factor transporter ATP-binding protein EcfA2